MNSTELIKMVDDEISILDSEITDLDLSIIEAGKDYEDKLANKRIYDAEMKQLMEDKASINKTIKVLTKGSSIALIVLATILIPKFAFTLTSLVEMPIIAHTFVGCGLMLAPLAYSYLGIHKLYTIVKNHLDKKFVLPLLEDVDILQDTLRTLDEDVFLADDKRAGLVEKRNSLEDVKSNKRVFIQYIRSYEEKHDGKETEFTDMPTLDRCEDSISSGKKLVKSYEETE